MREPDDRTLFGFALVAFAAAGALAGLLGAAAAGEFAGTTAGAALALRGVGTVDMLARRKPASVSLSC